MGSVWKDIGFYSVEFGNHLDWVSGYYFIVKVKF